MWDLLRPEIILIVS